MEQAARDIVHKALGKGACSLAEKAADVRDLAALFFSPQGREFCQEHDFPSLRDFRRLAEETDLTRFGIYVDAGEVKLDNPRYAAAVGDTKAVFTFHGADSRHCAVLMHGARAKVEAREYAVAEVVCGRGCSYECDTDQTTVML